MPTLETPDAILRVRQTPEELDGIYSRDYYWYLRSRVFKEAFLKPLGKFVNDLRLPCLDVACGEGQLREYIRVPYAGFDGSPQAISLAKMRYPYDRFTVGRIEEPDVDGEFGTAVFGNLFRVIVADQAAFVGMYVRKYRLTYFIVYDLDCVDTAPIDNRYRLLRIYAATADLNGIQDIKKHRKIRVYSCK